jgi:Doubled CXXCH motif (Paired_CXXCH_1)
MSTTQCLQSDVKWRCRIYGAIILCCLVLGRPALAVHDGGVGACSNCHIMHNSEDGLAPPNVSGALLRGDSPSDICLSCHATASGSVLGSDPLSPPPELGAGNFVFLLEDEICDDSSNFNIPIGGYHSGHSIVAPGYGLFPDPEYTVAPGGTYPSSELGCTSCHDPHGNPNFRMLYGVGPIQGGLITFVSPAPVAEGLPVDVPGMVESPTAHTAYRSGMSAWCANCHGQYHDLVGDAYFEHGFDVMLDSSYINQYNVYDGTQNPSGGSSTTAYLVQVPYEDPQMTITSTQGPSIGAKVACISCHRAHATSAPRATRWDMRSRYLDDDGLESGSWPIPVPWSDPNERQLCLKCHTIRHGVNSPRSCTVCHAVR